MCTKDEKRHRMGVSFKLNRPTSTRSFIIKFKQAPPPSNCHHHRCQFRWSQRESSVTNCSQNRYLFHEQDKEEEENGMNKKTHKIPTNKVHSSEMSK